MQRPHWHFWPPKFPRHAHRQYRIDLFQCLMKWLAQGQRAEPWRLGRWCSAMPEPSVRAFPPAFARHCEHHDHPCRAAPETSPSAASASPHRRAPEQQQSERPQCFRSSAPLGTRSRTIRSRANRAGMVSPSTCLCRKRAARLPSLAEGKETGTNRRGGDVRFDLEMSRELWDQQENPTRLLRFERNPDDAPHANGCPTPSF